jgi:LysR family transcriptional regulator, cyn operon transcriptional activator
MNLRHLRTFVLIADAGGIAHASNRLHLSSPAASRQLLALEAEFNVRLFDRVGRRLQLTSQGKDLLERSRLLLAEADSLGERARALKGGSAGLLRIGAPPQVIEVLFAPFAARYRRRHPGVDIHLVEDASGSLPTRLEHGDIDVAEMAANDERFQSRLLFPIHALVVLPHAHRLARRAKVDIIDLAGEPMALPCREFPMRGWIDAAFDAANVRPKLLLESAVPHTLVAVAAANFAIAVVQSNVPIHHKGVRTIPLVVRGASIGIWSAIAWHPRRFLPPYAQRFIEEFVSFAPHANPGRDVIRRAPALPRPKEQRH